MNKKTLGIDVGSAFLKAVSLNCDFKGRLSIAASVLIDMNAAGGLEQALRKLFADKRFKEGKCVFSIPASSCSFRNLSFPFSEGNTLGEIITYELEPHIPDPIETVTVDHLPISSTSESTAVLAAAAKKQDIQELTQYANDRSITIIDTDAVPIALNILDNNIPDASWILLDVGADVSVAVFVQRNSIVHVRSFPWGIAESAGKCGNLPDIFKDKESKSTIKQTDTALRNEKRTGRNRLPWFQEIADTLQFLTAKGILEDQPARIYLTGGGALSAPLREDMESFFRLPVDVVDLLEMKGVALQGKNRLSWNAPLMNQALSLALRDSNGSRGFNFKKDDPACAEKTEGLKGYLQWSALMLLILFVALGTNLLAGYYADSRKLGQLKEEVTKSFKNSCPEVTRIVDPVRQLQQKINETRNFSGGIENGPLFLEQWKTAMDVLPENSGILVTGISYNQVSLEISGEASDYQTINRWKSDLEKAKSFSDIQMQFGSGKNEDTKKTFRLRMTHAL